MIPVQVYKGRRQILGYVQYTNLTAAIRLAPKGAVSALLQAEAQNIRYRDDGGTPTNLVGMLLKTTDPPYEFDGDLNAIQLIEVIAGAILNVTYLGPENV